MSDWQERASSRRMRTIIVLGNAVAILILLVAGFVIHAGNPQAQSGGAEPEATK